MDDMFFLFFLRLEMVGAQMQQEIGELRRAGNHWKGTRVSSSSL